MDPALEGCSTKVPTAVSLAPSVLGDCTPTPAHHVYPVTGRHSGPLYSFSLGLCSDATYLISGDNAFDLGPEMPPDAFAPMATSEHYPTR